MTTWAAKIKRVIQAFLATEDARFLTTEDGLYIEIIDLQNFSEPSKNSNTFTLKAKQSTSWNNKTQS